MRKFNKFAPTCSKCGEKIKPWFYDTETFVAGSPTFGGWDWKKHVCRIGIMYMIERKDNNHWFSENDTWTTDPMEARVFPNKEFAEVFLRDTNKISFRIECIVTEHEFVLPERGENLIDAPSQN